MDLQPGLKRAQMNQLAALLRKLVEGIDDPSQISSERKLLKLLPTTYGVCGMAIFSQASSVYGEECLPRREGKSSLPAVGTHPTGIHSCLLYFYVRLST